MRILILLLCLFIISFNTFAQLDSATCLTNHKIVYQKLSQGFQSPPAESRLRCYWWWLNGMATKESITRDLEEMKAKGYGGAAIVDAGSSNYDIAKKTAHGPDFLSPGWITLYQHAVKEADRLGIELTINLSSGWNPGGPYVRPEQALKKIVWSEMSLVGDRQLHIALPHPDSNLYYQDITVQAFPTREIEKIKNEAIEYWDIKSFTTRIGWKGIYPLNHLRDDYADSIPVPVIHKNEIIDLTAKYKNGILNWDVPEGNWTIIRYGYTCTGARTSTNSDGWEGLSLDHLSVEAFQLFGDSVIVPLIHAAQIAGHSLHFLQTDSWEMDVVNWTARFPEYFQKYRGYNINLYLPVLTGYVVESREESDRFLHDFRRTIGDCIRDNHYQLLYNLAHRYGLGIHPESGGPHSAPVDALQVMGINDYPQGEFWATSNTHRIKDDERLSVKQSACVAHTNGKRIVAAEGPTSIGPQWERSPKDLKANIDRVFCSGVNRIEWHEFTSSPKEFGLPGNEYFAGTHLNPNVTWWEQAGSFISYLNRCSFMLQQGLFVADVLAYYGDDVPNFVFLKEEMNNLNQGYDWDKCSKDIILNRIAIKDGRIVLPDGMSYRLLMLPDEKSIDLVVLRKIETLVNQGMILYGKKPESITGLANFPAGDSILNQITGRLWGKIDNQNITENIVGKGKIVWGEDINLFLNKMNITPDFQFNSPDKNTAFDYIHRTTSDQEIYFVANRFSHKAYNDFQYRYIPDLPDRYEQAECSFRVTGMQPEVWDPVTGNIAPVLVYTEVNGRTIIPLHFEPDGSKFIVFRNCKQVNHIVAVSKEGQSLFPNNRFTATRMPLFVFIKNEKAIHATFNQTGNYQITWSNGKSENIAYNQPTYNQSITGSWQIHFDTRWNAPGSITTDTLKSWTDFNDEGIKYYSGKATYVNNFSINKSQLKNAKIILDLGNVQEMASVRINGIVLHWRWSFPFQFDITDFIKPGDNQLEVDVVNLWPNRLIGDSKIPPEKRLTQTNVTKFNTPDSDKHLRVSGLLGPVMLYAIPVVCD